MAEMVSHTHTHTCDFYFCHGLDTTNATVLKSQFSHVSTCYDMILTESRLI